MVIIGLLLILAGAAVAASVIYENTGQMTMEIFGAKVDGSGAAMFILGAACMFAVLIGVWLLQTGLARQHRRRKEVKSLRRNRKDEVSALEADRARLADEKARLEAKLHDSDTTGPAADGGHHTVDLTGSREHTER